MKLMKCITMLLLGGTSLMILTAFSCNSGSSNFTVHIEDVVLLDDGSTVQLGGVQGVAVSGQFIADLGFPVGSLTLFSAGTDSSGNILVLAARIPAIWEIEWEDPRCANQVADVVNINPGDAISYPCVDVQAAPFTAIPNPVNETNLLPMTLQGSGLDPTFGMPEVDFYNIGGNYLGSSIASSVSADNTTLIVSPSPLSGMFNSSYAAVIKNVQSDGTTKILSAVRFGLTGNPRPSSPPPPPPHCTGRCLPQS